MGGLSRRADRGRSGEEMDKSMLGDLDSLPEEDKIKMARMIDQLQVSDRLVSSLPRRLLFFPLIFFHFFFVFFDVFFIIF